MIMFVKARFGNRSYEVVFTDHAPEQIRLRRLSEKDVVLVIENGTPKPKNVKDKFWVYMALTSRKDNLISVSISIEPPNLIVITTLVNWRPK